MNLLRIAQSFTLASAVVFAAPAYAISVQDVPPPVQSEVGEAKALTTDDGAAVGLSHGNGWVTYVGAGQSDNPSPMPNNVQDESPALMAATSLLLSEDKEKLRSSRLVMGYSYEQNHLPSDVLSYSNSGQRSRETGAHAVQMGLNVRF